MTIHPVTDEMCAWCSNVVRHARFCAVNGSEHVHVCGNHRLVARRLDFSSRELPDCYIEEKQRA